MSSYGAGFRLAMGTLTIIPVGEIGTVTPPVARVAMTAAPMAAVPVAVAVGGVVAAGAELALPPLVTGALAVAAAGLCSRGMHLDGLADTVDGLAAGWDRERALAVLRRGDVGPMGAAALVVVLLVQAAGLAMLAGVPYGWLVAAAAVVASRAACAAACARGVPAARPDGLGAAVCGSVPAAAVLAGWLVVTALVAGASRLSGSGWAAGPAAVAAAAVVVALAIRAARRTFGGVTGDVIGAVIELALTGLLVVLTAGGWR